MSQLAKILDHLGSSGPQSAEAVISALGLSRATLSRATRVGLQQGNLGRAGRTAAIQYFAARDVSGVGRSTELRRVDAAGKLHALATLHFVARRETVVIEWASGRVEQHPSAPWFLEDTRPQGFLGRQLLRRLSAERPELHWPRLDEFNTDAVIRMLALFGEDAPGAFVIGNQAAERYLRHEKTRSDRALARGSLAQRSVECARAALAGEAVGSSAGGEQPKFTADVLEPDGALTPVIVKFSAPQHNAVSQRWADLLAAEHIASQVLREHAPEWPVSQSELLQHGGQTFLIVHRFDRIGAHGRACVVSLRSTSLHVGGETRAWPDVTRTLLGRGDLDGKDHRQACRFEAFGRLIANSDRHLGNLSLFWEPTATKRAFRIAPLYDMLPMAFAPSNQGSMADDVELELGHGETLEVWDEALDLARIYWGRVAEDTRISGAFRQCAARMRKRLA